MNRLRPSRPTWSKCALPVVLLLTGLVLQSPAADESADWIEIRYDALVDARALSHSGESLGSLLRSLQGRPLPLPGERPGDRLAHSLIDPLLEPFAFTLSDGLDALRPTGDRPWFDVGRLWAPGEPQPAWAELLRARNLVVESDGVGKMRVLLPIEPGSPAPGTSEGAALERYESWWPVLRHVFSAERRRLAAAGAGESPALEVEVHAFAHQPARARFRLGLRPYVVRVEDTRSDGRRPPLDLEALQAFLDTGLQLEGGRLDPEGRLRLLGSRRERSATLLGQPLTPADFAVAYRAVRHGGLAEPYMSLDRGASPHAAVVNYGGRLRDTGLGWVSLLCDIRFKTFSLGLDIVGGRDLRSTIRKELPEFRSHLERFAENTASQGVLGQQTRLWFYPDAVDLTVSEPGDLLALRRVRMSAASERVASGTMTASAEKDPPWTRATVAAINDEYDALARFFPEMDDLDQVVRLLSLFTWLRQAESRGVPLPDLDVLLDLELPVRYTPRDFPQLLAFNALPQAGGTEEVVVVDRVPVGAALERLSPNGDGRLAPQERLLRAVSALDSEDPQHAALLTEFRGYDRSGLDPGTLDLMAYRAERLRMHDLVLTTLDRERARPLAKRMEAGEELRIFSVGIGGLDLGMDQVLERSASRSLSLTGLAPATARPVRTSKSPTVQGAGRDEWRSAASPSGPVLPDHGSERSDGVQVERQAKSDRRPASQTVVYDADGAEPTARRVEFDAAGRGALFDRYEAGRSVRYRFEREGDLLTARPVGADDAATAADPVGRVPAGLVRMTVLDPLAAQSSAAAPTPLRLEATVAGTPRKLEADFPRAVLERLVLGPLLDRDRSQPMPLNPLPPSLGTPEAILVSAGTGQRQPPWLGVSSAVPGERDPVRLARALGRWRRDEVDLRPNLPAVLGTDPEASPARWTAAPRVGPGALLWVPEEAFSGRWAEEGRSLLNAWGDGPRIERRAGGELPWLVVLVSDEPPSRLARRLRQLSQDPAMEGRMLAVWSLAGPLRPDLPASLLAEGRLAAVGVAGSSLVARREAVSDLALFSQAIENPLEAGGRVEAMPGPFLWFY